jgi:hypothetical protein
VFFKSSYNSSYERGDILMFSPLLSSPLLSTVLYQSLPDPALIPVPKPL